MKNKLSDLNDHLFAQIERLGDETLSQDKLAIEVVRSKQVAEVAKVIVANADLRVRASQFIVENPSAKRTQMPAIIGTD